MNDSSPNERPGLTPEVSVIINCFNEAPHLRDTLDSVFAQTLQDWEIVFWDNASTDGSGEIAANYGERVRCFRSDTMVPLGRARELAYDQTRGKYIAILDADDQWLPRKLESQVALLQADPRLGMVYCDAISFDEKKDRHRLFKHAPPYRGNVFRQLIIANFICTSTTIFRREALDQLGSAFDAKYTRAQDHHLALKIAYQFPIDYVDEPLARWRINGAAKPWKQGLASRAEELERSLEDFLDTYPEVKTNYAPELKSFYKILDYEYGVAAWQKGERSEARGRLSRHLSDKKFAFIYLCTLLMSGGSFYRLSNTLRNLTPGRL